MKQNLVCLFALLTAGCNHHGQEMGSLSISVADHSSIVRVGNEEHSITEGISAIESKIADGCLVIEASFGKNGIEPFESDLKVLCAKHGTKLIIHYAPPSFESPSESEGQDTKIDLPSVSKGIEDAYFRPDN